MRLGHIYYVAALLDGEGSFQYGGTPTIHISSTDEDILGRLLTYMKVIKFISKNKKALPGHKQCYHVSICGKVAAQWMMTIYPLMCKRRKAKIKEVLTEWKASLNKEGSLCSTSRHKLEGRNLILENTPTGFTRRCRACRAEKDFLRGSKRGKAA